MTTATVELFEFRPRKDPMSGFHVYVDGRPVGDITNGTSHDRRWLAFYVGDGMSQERCGSSYDNKEEAAEALWR
jgi:hypothetical protein